MQVTETVSDGLKREFKVVVPAADLATKADAKLGELKDQVRINGFRPGKVPVAHLKRLYGRSVMAEMIEAAVREANAKIVTERGFKLAREPKVTLPSEQGAVEQVIEGKSRSRLHGRDRDPADDRARGFQGHQARAAERRGDRRRDRRGAGERIAEQNRPFAAKGEGAKAENGDRVTIDFTGKIDGTPFEGGTGDDVARASSARTRSSRASRSSSIGMTAGETAHRQGDVPADLSGGASRRQGRRVRRHREVDRGAAARSRSTTNSPSRSAWNRSPSSRDASRSGIAREHARHVAAEAQAQAARRARRACTSSRRRRRWSRTSSTTSGRRSRTTCKHAEPHLRGRRTRPRRRPRPSTATSPSGACGSASCSPRSARRTTSR